MNFKNLVKTFIMTLSLTASVSAWTSSPLSTIKEVFLRGSIDGKHLFLIYGINNAAHDIKEIVKDYSVNVQDFVDIGHMVSDYGQIIDDAINHSDPLGARSDFDQAGHIIKEIPSSAWEQITNAPQAFKVDMEAAQEARYRSSNPIAGAIKYSGLATWACVQGSYYLVVAAPIDVVGHLADAAIPAAIGTAIVPLAVTLHTGAIIGNITMKFLQEAFVGTSTMLMGTYSAATSSIATLATVAATGIYATFEAGKWLIMDAPTNILYPIRVNITTDADLSNQREITQNVLKKFEEMDVQVGKAGQFAIKANAERIGDYTSTISLETSGLKKNFGIGKINVGIKNQKVVLTALINRAAISAKSKLENISNQEAKKRLEEYFGRLLSEVQ